VTQIITATIAITMGVTIYEAPEGTGLACRGHAYDTSKEWVAVPTEWLLGGYLDCKDLAYGCLPNGHCLDGVPVRDTGCLLHYPVWPVEDRMPFGLDIPLHMREWYGNFHTGRMTMQFYRVSEQSWWTPSQASLTAWDTVNCDGPLTLRGWPWGHIPN